MTVFIDGAKRQGRLMGMTPEMVELMGLTMSAGGVRGRVNLESGKREREHHYDFKGLFHNHWAGKKGFQQTHTLAQLAKEAKSPAIERIMKQLVLRVEDVDRKDWGKYGWMKKQRPEAGKGMEPTKVQDPKIIYGRNKWTPGMDKIKKLIDDSTEIPQNKKAALKRNIESNIKKVRNTYAGHQSPHHEGLKGDIPYSHLNPKTIATWEALGLPITHEPKKRIIDTNFTSLEGVSPGVLRRRMESPLFKQKVRMIQARNKEKARSLSNRSRSTLSKKEKFYLKWYNQVGTGNNRTVSKFENAEHLTAKKLKWKTPEERRNNFEAYKSLYERYKDVSPRAVLYKRKMDYYDDRGTSEPTTQSQEMQIFNKETVEEPTQSKEMQHFNKEPNEEQTKNTGQKYIPSHTPMEDIPQEMKVKAEGSSLPLAPKLGETVEEEMKVKEEVGPQYIENMDMVDEYKMRKGSQSLKGVPSFEKGGAVFKEPELSDDPKMRARQTGETDIIDEAVEDKVEGTVPTPQDAWRLKPEEPKKPKPPVEASIKGDTVVLTKQEQVDDVDKMSVVELKDKLQETKEVVSEPNSDTVTIKSRPSQIQKSKKLKAELDKRKQWAEESSDAAVKVGIRETPGRMGQSQVDVTEDVKLTEEEADPKAVSIYDIFRSSEGITEEARLTLKDELNKASEVEQNLQKIEPMRFWNTMSTPAKIVAGIGMLIGGYYGTKSAAGTQAIMDVIDGAVNADISAQKLTRDQQLSTAKEATRRAKAAVDKYTAMATSPDVRAKLASLAQALDIKKAGIEKTQQIQHLKHYVMNEARAGRLHLVPPAIMRLVYPKEEMKRIDTLRENFEKERKDRKIAPTISAYRRLHNLIASDQKISGADDISIVFQFMKMLDPNSVVREGEFKTAEGAGPRAEYFARQWNRMWNGGRFVESDRKAFLQSALKMIKPAMDDEKDLQRKYVSMARRYGYPAAFIISPSVRYFDLPGTKDEAGIRKIMKEQGKTREEASDIHYQVRKKVKPLYYHHKGVKYRAN